MAKSKFIAIVASAALVAMLGLTACGGQASSSAAKSASASSAAASSASASASASSSASSSTTSSASSASASASTASASAEETLISWQGALVDGTLVDYISSDDGKNGGFVLTKKNAEPQRWLGAMTTTEDGKVTITDDNTKEVVNFTLTGATRDGAVTIDVEGYGQGALVPMTAADWKRVAEAEELAKTLGTVVNTMGVFEDGSLVVYMQNQEGTDAAVAVMPKGATQMKTWTGKTSTAADGKETVTDSETGETFTYTWTENPNDGTIAINADGYGKGLLVKMTVADWMLLDEAAKANR